MHCRLGASARKATAVAVNPDLSTATAAVHRSAASLGATLTPGDIAIKRAGLRLAVCAVFPPAVNFAVVAVLGAFAYQSFIGHG